VVYFQGAFAALIIKTSNAIAVRSFCFQFIGSVGDEKNAQ
jgi:hypothetical protein